MSRSIFSSDILKCNCYSNSEIATLETMLQREEVRKEKYEFRHQVAMNNLRIFLNQLTQEITKLENRLEKALKAQTSSITVKNIKELSCSEEADGDKIENMSASEE